MQKVRSGDVSELFGWLVASKDRKYFDSGDYALSKAGVAPQSTVGTAIPNPEKWAFCWEVYRCDETLSASLAYLMPHLVSPMVTRFLPFLQPLPAQSIEKVAFLRWISSSLEPMRRLKQKIGRTQKTKWRNPSLRRRKWSPAQRLEESKKSELKHRKSMTPIQLSDQLLFWIHRAWSVLPLCKWAITSTQTVHIQIVALILSAIHLRSHLQV